MKESTHNYTYSNPILFYDGVCHLCQKSVQWIFKREVKNIDSSQSKILFAPLQGETAQKISQELGVNLSEYESLVIYHQSNLTNEGQILLRSEAVFFCLKFMKYPEKLCLVFKIIPKVILNLAYDLIAGTRYKIFGKSKVCWIPKSEWEERFLP